MNRRGWIYVSVCLMSLLLTGCIRDEIEPCPPFEIKLAVKDKNYFNVDKVDLEERLDEDLPFRAYVPNLRYQLRDAVTGDILEEQEVAQIESDEKEFTFSYCCLPHGKYIVTVWGGMHGSDILDEEGHTLTFHPDHTQGDDVYMVCDTLTYDAYNYNHTLQMERTKGKLIIQSFNLPDDVNVSLFKIDHLFEQVDRTWTYGGQTDVNHHAEVIPEFEVVEKVLLSPSTGVKESILKIGFYCRKDTHMPLIMFPPDIRITMFRNELTVVRYVYDPSNDDMLIFMLINDTWQQVHDLEIN